MHGDDRPRFHLTPPANWMNDPNGLFIEEGRLHVFYQHNPVAPHWDRVHWGHAVTEDLVTWRHLPIAIGPDAVGPDSLGCWSGCIVDEAGVATMFYTGVARDGDVRHASICAATSVDALRTWTKDPANPRIAGAPDGIAADAFRDPFVWRDGEGWAMLVGAGTTGSLGAVLLYRSADLRHWAYVGPLLSSDDIDRAAGADAPCWECPSLVRMGAVDVLVVSVVDRTPGVRPSHVAAFVGRLDGDRFAVDHADQLGMGPDFYAPASIRASDGRHLLVGWIPEDPPQPSAARTWAGAMTFPRVVSIARDGRVSLALAGEVTTLRAERADHLPGAQRVLEAGADPWRLDLPGQPVEIQATIDPRTSDEVGLDLLDGDDDAEARVTFRPRDRVLAVARRGFVMVAGRNSRSAMVIAGADDGALHLRVIIDGSVMELEANGSTMATLRLSTTRRARRAVALWSVGGDARVEALATWTLEAHATGSPE